MINQLNSSLPVVDDSGVMVPRFILWTDNVRRFAPIVGTGSPEGIIEAVQTQFYMDDAGTAGNILYIKRDFDISGDRSQGWILV